MQVPFALYITASFHEPDRKYAVVCIQNIKGLCTVLSLNLAFCLFILSCGFSEPRSV